MKFIPVALFVLMLNFQDSSAQKIKEKFNLKYYSENFDSSKTDWTIVANNENLFIIQDGEYILNRKTTLSPFAVVFSKPINLAGYKVVTSLKLDRTLSIDGSIGLMFALQEGNSSGFLLEFSFNKEFRIRKFLGSQYTYITGSEKSGGWIKNNFINEATVPTLIEIHALGMDYDLYFNNKFVQSFSDIELQKGNCGFVIGPGTKGRVDFFYIFTDDKYIEHGQSESLSSGSKDNPAADIAIITTALIEQKTKINQLSEENELLKRTIDAMKNEGQQESDEKKLILAKLAAHDAEMLAAQKRYDSLQNENKELMKYKEIVAGNENSDLVITLSKSLKAKAEENEQLKKQNKLLSDSLQRIVNPGQPKKQEQPEQPKQNNGINLPGGNGSNQPAIIAQPNQNPATKQEIPK